MDWGRELAEQITWHWRAQLRPRLEGLTDEEYFWEPVPGCWSVRPRAEATTPTAAGGGDYVIDYAYPAPIPAPVTTIAWRIGHILVGVLGWRNARYFGGPQVDFDTYVFPVGAVDALRRLDQEYATWVAGITALTGDELAENCREPGFENSSIAALVLHIHRELIHHGAEIALLRDLYTWRETGRPIRS